MPNALSLRRGTICPGLDSEDQAVRHLKCDGKQPCGRCAKKNLSCDRNLKIRFRHSSFSGSGGSQHGFSSDQTWCRTNGKKIRFLDQTLEVVRSYDDDESGSEGDANAASQKAPISRSPAGSASTSNKQQKRRLSPDEEINDHLQSSEGFLDLQPSISHSSGVATFGDRGHHPRPRSSSGEQSHYSEALLSGHGFSTDLLEAINAVSNDVSLNPYPIPGSQEQHSFQIPVAKLERLEKEQLLRHFVDDLGLAFSLYDPINTEVPERAAACSPLLDLILSASAKHLCTITGSAQFSEARLSAYPTELIRTLCDPGAVGMDHTSLALAALLLRLCQNIEGACSHLETLPFSSWTIPKVPASPISSDPFHEALFWASLQQELYLAIMHQTPIQMSLDRLDVESRLQQFDDKSWTKMMLFYLVETVQYCFGGDQSPEKYDRLLAQVSIWADTKPSWFVPVHSSPPKTGSMLPELWFLTDFIAAGLQYYHLVRILLTSHHPRIPRLGSAQKAAMQWIDDQIKGDVKIICGIAESISEINATHLTACITIGLVGDRFSNRSEQELLFGILTRTTNKFGWSTTFARKQLREAWGWEAEPEHTSPSCMGLNGELLYT